jgi:hypothetical protein
MRGLYYDCAKILAQNMNIPLLWILGLFFAQEQRRNKKKIGGGKVYPAGAGHARVPSMPTPNVVSHIESDVATPEGAQEQQL